MLWGRSRLKPGIAVAVCAVAAGVFSGGAGAVDQVFTVGQDQPMGVVLNDGESLDNAARISDDGDPGNILISTDGVGSSPSILNRATGRIVNTTDIAINVDGAVGSFINRGEVSGFNNAVVIGGDVGSFLNESLITSVDWEAVVLNGTTGRLTNSGRIEGFDGVAAFEVGTLTNTAGASIIGNGVCGGFPCGVALNALMIDLLDNAGTIAGGSAGATLMDASIVRNSGRISGGEQGLAVGALPYVPFAFPGVTTDIVNHASGVIEATELAGCGCFPTVGLSFVNGTLNNMGTIRGGIGVAIVGDGTTGVVVTNSGKIEGFTPVTMLGTHDVSMAMLFDTYDFQDPYDPVANNLGLARDDTLILLQGSRILGAVDYANGVDTLDLRQYQGNQALLNYNLEQVLIGTSVTGQSTSGNMTFVVTVDDTALRTAAPTQFNSFTKGVFSSIRGASGGNPVGTEGTPLAYAPSFSTPAGEAASNLAGGDGDTNAGKVWVGSFGDLARDDTAMHAFSQQLGGVVAGAHAALDKSTRLGIVVSGGSSLYATDLQTQTIRGTLGALGLYGDTDLGMMTADFALLAGAAANHSERNVTGIFGDETAVADYTGWFLSPALGLGIPVFELEAVDARADVRVRYLGGQTGAYTETGSSMNLSVPAQAVSLAEARAGFTATAELDVLTLSATVGALVQSNLGGTTTSFALAGPTGSIPLTSTTPGTTATGLYGSASLDLALGANARVTATAGAEIRTDGFRSMGGSVNLGGTF